MCVCEEGGGEEGGMEGGRERFNAVGLPYLSLVLILLVTVIKSFPCLQQIISLLTTLTHLSQCIHMSQHKHLARHKHACHNTKTPFIT